MIRLGILLLIAAGLAACASSTGAPVEQRAAPASTAATGTVVVPAGATLYEIAERERVSLRALIDANGLRYPFDLSAGQVLRLPAGNSYTVARGDTLNAIARRFSIQPRSLALLNGLDEPYRLQPGQVLALPGPPGGGAVGAAGARPRAAAPTGPAPQFAWPIDGRVVDEFGPKGGGRRNDGVNIAARAGDPVLAAADGVVVYAGDDLEGYGNLLLVQHADGWVSAYAHLSRLLASEEQAVAKGDRIAEAGATGAVDGPQLHFELRRNGGPVDPLSELPRQPR